MPRLSVAHQTRRQTDIAAHHAIGVTAVAATTPRPHLPPRQPNLQGRDKLSQVRRQVAQSQRRPHRSRRVIFMRLRRAKRRINESALVANGQLQQHTAMMMNNTLHPGNEGIQFFTRRLILVEINPAKLEHQRRHRPQVAQDAAAAVQLFINCWQYPLAG